MMVAQFCSYEILLFACDDGDVLAYYTHLLAQGTKKIDDGTKAPDCSLRPFFHETVIKSAWYGSFPRSLAALHCVAGLAI